MKTCVVPDALTLPSRRDSFSVSVIFNNNKNLNMKSISLVSNGKLSVATCKFKFFVLPVLINIFSLLGFNNHFHITCSYYHKYDQGQTVCPLYVLWDYSVLYHLQGMTFSYICIFSWLWTRHAPTANTWNLLSFALALLRACLTRFLHWMPSECLNEWMNECSEWLLWMNEQSEWMLLKKAQHSGWMSTVNEWMLWMNALHKCMNALHEFMKGFRWMNDKLDTISIWITVVIRTYMAIVLT